MKSLHVSTFLLLKGKYLINCTRLDIFVELSTMKPQRYQHSCICMKTNSLLYLLERIQKSFDGKLVGADRAKDIAVLKVRCI